MSEIDIRETLLAFLCRSFFVDVDEIRMDESLVDQGIIDSFGLVEISGHISGQYGIAVTESEMNRANFGSVEKIVRYILSKTGGRP